MFLPFLLLLAQDHGAGDPTLDAALREYREKTRSDYQCRRSEDENEIVVCALRDADRYRVPLITTSAGREAADARMRTLLSPEASGYVPCGKGAFMVRCGSVGVGATIDGGGGARASMRYRPLAP